MHCNPECAPKWPDEGRPKRVWSLAEKCWTGVEISSSYVIHFEVVFCIYERQIVFQGIENLRQARMRCKVARKPPKSSSKPVPRHGRMHCKVTRRPSRSSPKTVPRQARKQPQSCSKSARMRCKSGTSRRKGGSTQVLCRYLAGLFLCLRPRF